MEAKELNNMALSQSNLKVKLEYEGKVLSTTCEIILWEKRLTYKANGKTTLEIFLQFNEYSSDGEHRLLNTCILKYQPADFQDARKKFIYPSWFLFNVVLSRKDIKYIFGEILRIVNLMEYKTCYEYYPGYNLVADGMVYKAADKLIYKDKIKACRSDDEYRLAEYAIGAQCVEFAGRALTDIAPIRNLFIASMIPYVYCLIELSEYYRYDPVFIILEKEENYATELSKVFTRMYVYKDDSLRPANQFDLDSDTASLEQIIRYDFCSILLDGLKHTGDKELDKKTKHNAITLINRKRGVNNSLHDGVNVSNRNSLIITANYFFDKLPLITRCVFIDLDVRCSRKNLTWYQKNVKYLIGLKICFIQYIERNREELMAKMKTLLSLKHYKTHKADSPKLCDSKAIMYAATEIFLDFYKEFQQKYPVQINTDCSETNGFKPNSENEKDDYWNKDYDETDTEKDENDAEPDDEGCNSYNDDHSEELEMFNTDYSSYVFEAIDKCIEDTAERISECKDGWKQKLIDDFLWQITSGNAKFVTDSINQYLEELESCDGRLPKHFVCHDSANKRFYVRAEHLEMYFYTLDKRKFSKKTIPEFFVTDNDKGEEFSLIDTEGKEKTVHALLNKLCRKRFISIREKPTKKYVQHLD